MMCTTCIISQYHVRSILKITEGGRSVSRIGGYLRDPLSDSGSVPCCKEQTRTVDDSKLRVLGYTRECQYEQEDKLGMERLEYKVGPENMIDIES